MPQWHRIQYGMFHVTTNTQDKEAWCVFGHTPCIIINNLILTKRIQGAKIYAFCILPDHMHIILEPGQRGLSAFMKSFKENSSRDIRRYRQNVSADAGVCAEIPTQHMLCADIKLPCVCAEKPTQHVLCADPKTPIQYAGVFHGWQHGFHATPIQTIDHYNGTLRYVECNASRHGLARTPKDWPWTSLHFRNSIDVVE